MENYIDWTGKTQLGSSQGPTSSTNPQAPAVYWQDNSIGSGNTQNPYSNAEHEQKHVPEQAGRQHSDYGQQAFRSPYPNGIQMSPSLTPPIANATQYMYPQVLSQSGYGGTVSPTVPPAQQDSTKAQQRQQQQQQQAQQQQQPQQQQQQQQQQQHLLQPPQQQQQSYHQAQTQNYPNPYSYANNANSYHSYAQQGPASNNYLSPYNPQAVPNMGSNSPYNGYQMMQSGSQLPRSNSPQVQFPYRPTQGLNSTPYLQSSTFQYQRPEDALKRVHQQTWPSQFQYQNHSPSISNGQNSTYTQWQAPAVGQTVYYPMDPRPSNQEKPKPVVPSSPPRPTEPLAALRYDVSHCFTEYNTSRDLKGCSAALLAIMATCDPVVPAAGATSLVASAGQTVASEKSSLNTPKDELEPKIKQTTLLAVVSSEIKGAMIEEVSRNKSIRAKLRTWFVRAHKDNSYVVLKAIISVLDKLTFLSALLLAEVKFGKALVIVSRKCEDKEVKDSLARWVSKAESSLIIEKELDTAATAAASAAANKVSVGAEEPKKKKTKVLPTSSGLKSDGRASPPLSRSQDASLKREDEKSKPGSVATKKSEAVAKTNTAFFKKDTLPTAKPVIAKPGMAAALAGIKARKKSDADEGIKNKVSINTSPKPVSSSLPKSLQPVKPAFSALKLVEGLKRTASPAAAPDTEPEAKKRKQKKSVSWRPDAELEQIKIFESLEPEDGEGDVAHTPHEYGNARDLDRKEGALMHGGILPDREEDFLDWVTPKDLDFSHRDLAQGNSSRGPKKAGTMKIVSGVSDAEDAREKSTFLVTYGTLSDIPWTPLESLATNDQHPQEPGRPRIIPLPAELRDDWRVKQVLGDLVNARTPVYATTTTSDTLSFPMSLPTPNASEAGGLTSAAGTPDIAAILAGILATQQAKESAPAAETIQSSLPDLPSRVVDTPLIPSNDGSNGLPAGFDPKLADFLAKMAAANGGMLPPPPPPPPSGTQEPSTMGPSSGFPGTNFPVQIQGMRDVRPWVKLNDGGKYREPCRFIGLGRCEKGDSCPYIHPQF